MPKQPDFINETFLRKRSAQIVLEKVENATIFDKEKEMLIPRFKMSEVRLGKVLGKGGFCTISNLEDINLLTYKKNRTPQDSSIDSSPKNENDFCTSIIQDRDFICNNFIRNGKYRYALKKLSPEVEKCSDPQLFVCGVIDLAMEVKFLSILRHPNIIKLRAIADMDSCAKNFFIILDSLDLTLGDQIDVWRKEKPCGFGCQGRQKREEDYSDRLCVGYDICSALSYVHANRIVYRDLKPANIGFDVRGDVKLFDFGLAAELSEIRRVGTTNTFHLTKDTGSPRYMAPEVFLGKPYNEKADVYSFGLILWQILQLKQPFDSYNFKKMKSRVFSGNATPKVNSQWTVALRTGLNSCWLRDISERKSCEEMSSLLRSEISLYDGSKSNLDVSNRSAHSLAIVQE